MTNEEIVAANKLTAQDNDWAKEQRRIEMGTEQNLKGPRHRPLYSPENPDTKNEVLQQIIKENIQA